MADKRTAGGGTLKGKKPVRQTIQDSDYHESDDFPSDSTGSTIPFKPTSQPETGSPGRKSLPREASKTSRTHRWVFDETGPYRATEDEDEYFADEDSESDETSSEEDSRPMKRRKSVSGKAIRISQHKKKIARVPPKKESRARGDRQHTVSDNPTEVAATKQHTSVHTSLGATKTGDRRGDTSENPLTLSDIDVEVIPPAEGPSKRGVAEYRPEKKRRPRVL